jgi:hypothetical protein
MSTTRALMPSAASASAATRRRDHQAVRDDRQVRALAHAGRLAEREALRRRVVDERRLRPTGPDVDGAVVLIGGRTTARIWCSSLGTQTTKWGSAHASATSSTDCWLAPSSPIEMPPWLPTTFTFSRGYDTAIRNWSNPFRITNAAKLEMKGTLPQLASRRPCRPGSLPGCRH